MEKQYLKKNNFWISLQKFVIIFLIIRLITGSTFLFKLFCLIVVPILAIGILVYFTLKLYFWRNQYSKSQYFNLRFIFVIFIIVFIIHALCILSNGINELGSAIKNEDVFKVVAIGFKEIYSQLGGLTFEGQSFNANNVFSEWIYFGSIAWLAITNAIIITSSLIYEFSLIFQ